jgi:hypothetical protein
MVVEGVKKVGQGAKPGAEETENMLESFGEASRIWAAIWRSS